MGTMRIKGDLKMKVDIASQMFRNINKIFAWKGLSKITFVMRAYNFLCDFFYYRLYSYFTSKSSALVEVRGHKMYIHTSDCFVSKELLTRGVYEKEITDLFKRIVKEGMTFVDIGAHIGYYTLLVARLVGKTGKVYAFEPADDSYALLVKNIEINGYNNVIPVKKAISNKSGAKKLFLNPRNKADNRLWNSEKGYECINIEETSLDEFFETYDSKIDVIKMDIEGYEMKALQGMNNIIIKNPNLKIITEFWPGAIEGSGFSPIEFLNKLVEWGFKLYTINAADIEPADPTHLIEICADESGRGGLGTIINVYCERR